MLLSDKAFALCLNKNWLPIDIKSVGEAICKIYSKEYLAIDILKDGEDVSFIPYRWNEWIKLPLKENDMTISSINMKIKIPTVIIANNYTGLRKIKKKLSNKSIMERDNYTCQYSGKKFSYEEALKYGSIDHIIPKSKSGPSSWENLVFCDKSINSRKGNKTPEEAGLKLIKKPSDPGYVMEFQNVSKKPLHENWNYFIIK